MAGKEHQPSDPQPPNRQAGQRQTWVKWVIGRGLVGAIFAAALLTGWPMLKGVYYGVTQAEEVPPEQLPAWRESYGAALAEAGRTGKPVLIDFTAEWCPPCRVMEHEVWPDPRVRRALEEHVIPLQVDVDAADADALLRRYSVRQIPTILLVDAEGRVVRRNAYMGTEAMLSFVRSGARPAEADEG